MSSILQHTPHAPSLARDLARNSSLFVTLGTIVQPFATAGPFPSDTDNMIQLQDRYYSMRICPNTIATCYNPPRRLRNHTRYKNADLTRSRNLSWTPASVPSLWGRVSSTTTERLIPEAAQYACSIYMPRCPGASRKIVETLSILAPDSASNAVHSLQLPSKK